MRIRMLAPEELTPDLRAMLDRWQADGGDPNFIRTFGHLPERLVDFVRFYSPLVRRGRLDHRLKELVRLRLAQLNTCEY
jgi:hypothetical protein